MTDDETKVAVSGDMQLLFKRLGNGQISAEIENIRRDIFLRSPEGERAAEERNAFVEECRLIVGDSDFSVTEKLALLQQIKDGFSAPPPTAGNVLGGWLQYVIGPCRRLGGETVRCNGKFQNEDPQDHVLGVCVAQTGGIRNINFDKFGYIRSVDDQANTYVAVNIKVGSRSNDETGQFGFTLFSGLPTPFSIDFDNVALKADSFYRLTLPLIDGANSNGSEMDVVINNIAIVE